ncbi:MAG: acyl-CoA/acyl-ACP dehydrogenase [Actinobacteria bacterium]|nr:acyl-CoA/acyl-ACP dehydrogenase [Actinomycetota bacterium]MCA1720157.1 acyl-CoA/acyl-ACP dehydrogenase [Actinomycetota bacterium]
MTYLAEEFEALDRFLPGLAQELPADRLGEHERDDGTAIAAFRAAGGPALVVPADNAGLGASCREACLVQRAIGSLAPALAVASTMHHFSIASIALLGRASETGNEWLLLQAVAEQRLLVASGFAEGHPQQAVLSPAMTARRVDGGLIVNGTKKPCSLSRSMDLLTGSVSVGPEGQFAVVLVSAADPGLSVSPFWASPVLAAAQSDAVTVTDAFVDDRLVFYSGSSRMLDAVQTTAFRWFELLISASYIGMGSRLASLCLESPRTGARDCESSAGALDAVMQAILGAARDLDQPIGSGNDSDGLAKALHVRYLAQAVLADTVRTAVVALGGQAFITNPVVSYLQNAAQALAFHPPALDASAPRLRDHMLGKPLQTID